jgi:hypothetical protein
MAVLEKSRVPSSTPPLLQQGDVLARSEFERRYAAMPGLKKAELIEGNDISSGSRMKTA